MWKTQPEIWRRWHLDAGLVDALLPRDEITRRTEEQAGTDSTLSLQEYLQEIRPPFELPHPGRIGIVVAEGVITDDSDNADAGINAETVKLIQQAREDEKHQGTGGADQLTGR